MTKDYIEQQIKKALKEANVVFSDVELEDDDINLSIKYDGEKYLDKLGQVSLFLCYQIKKEKLIAIDPQLYLFKETNNDVILKVVSAVNEVISGKVTYDDSTGSIWYAYDEKVRPDAIMKELFEMIKLDYIIAILTTVRTIIEEKSNEE